MSKKLLVLATATAVFAGMASNAFALEEIIKNYRGIRSLGMGGVVTTTGRYDEALFGNPATQMEDEDWKLTILGLTLEANTNIMSDYKKVTDAKNAQGADAIRTIADKGIVGRNEHTRLTVMVPGYYNPKLLGENTGFAFGLLVNSQTNIMLRSDVAVDTQAVVDVGPNFGFGHKFLNGDLDVGVNMHLLYRLASAQDSIRATDFLAGKKIEVKSIGGQGIGFDMDLGGYYKLPFNAGFFKKISVGGSFNGLLKSRYRLAGKELISVVKGTPPANDRTFNTGVKFDLPDLAFLYDTLLALEVQDIGTLERRASFWKRVHIGSETKLSKVFALRAGFNQGYIGGGVGIDLPIVKIDLATYGEELSGNTGQTEDRRVALRLSFDI